MKKMKWTGRIIVRIVTIFLVTFAFCLTACGSQTTTTEEGNLDMECENRYMELLGSYLKEQLELERYDKAVEELGCVSLNKEDQSDAQKRRNMGLTYIYLRNDLHLERLAEEDVKVLRESLGKEEGEEREKAMEVVVRTFPICTMPVLAQDEEEKNFPYVYDNTVDAQSGARNVTIDSLVLQIATQSEYDDAGEYVNPDKERQKREELYKLAEQMEFEMDGLLGEKPIRVMIDFIL